MSTLPPTPADILSFEEKSHQVAVEGGRIACGTLRRGWAGWGPEWYRYSSITSTIPIHSFASGQQEALLLATQDERIMIRTGDDYIKFYDQPGTPPSEVVRAWWMKYRRLWAPSDTSRTGDR